MREYNFSEIEEKWKKKWEEEELFKNKSKEEGKENYYVLEMFPYPSGNIHMGHVRNYTIGDVIGRYKTMNGYNVLHPIGWDSFGLPAENAAIKNKIHPYKWTLSNIDNMKKQLKMLGFSYDWDREIATCKEDYYKWNQWIFIKMYEKGLVYKKKSNVNWCNSCNTVLANEQVKDGKCWRCDNEVIQKKLEQWFFKITDYADELLEGHKKLRKGWPEKILTMQKNWIGRSYGTEINFKLEDKEVNIPVFTTRADTIYGVTYLVIAPEYDLVDEILEERPEIREEIMNMRNEDKISRMAEGVEKTGVFTGRYVINPLNNERVPLWIGNYVLTDYGTGAVMAVPAHDERDFEFAKKYNLEIKIVISPKGEELKVEELEKAYTKKGILINSKEFNGMENKKALNEIARYIEEEKIGKKTVNYRLKDWLVSRQRYWGTPIPVVYCEKCGMQMEKIENLPIKLPSDIEFTENGNPLESSEEFKNAICPKCGGKARRETDTMDTFVDSSWYYLRYTDPKEKGIAFKRENADAWTPVNQYIGGVEHAVMHLLYSRFLHKVLRDFGMVSSDEPFKNLLTQGMVLGPSNYCEKNKKYYNSSELVDGKCPECGEKVITKVEKMSKSKNNGVDPEHIIKNYGADTARLFTLFAAPPERELEWNENGLVGGHRFLTKLWRLVVEKPEFIGEKEINIKKVNKEEKKLVRKLHQTIKKVTESIENNFHFNTAIAATMELLNEMTTFKVEILEKGNYGEEGKNVWGDAVKKLVLMLSPFVPHITDELWNSLKMNGTVYKEEWPKYVEEWTKSDEVILAIQINGKLRDTIEIAINKDKAEIEKMALDLPKIKKYIEEKEIKKVIVIPNKIVNIVIK